MQNKSTYTAKCGCKVVEGRIVDQCARMFFLTNTIGVFGSYYIISKGIPEISNHIQTALTEKK